MSTVLGAVLSLSSEHKRRILRLAEIVCRYEHICVYFYIRISLMLDGQELGDHFTLDLNNKVIPTFNF